MMKKYTLTFNTWGEKQLSIYEHRIKNIRLKWCKQLFKIINIKTLFRKKKLLLIDLGCNYFQLYKEIKIRKINKLINYFGYESEKKYINIGLKYFPELKKKYKICNVESAKLKINDISVCSAVLEHIEKPTKIINHILKTTKKVVIFRTFLGKKNKKQVFFSSSKNGYLIRQFDKYQIKRKMVKFGFKVKFHLDEATNKKSYFVNGDKRFKRKFYFIVGTKT
jgi:2-polyprenyl-3-methyl-5-hydroxy-6-metoxy-1,4-benzoquinol methylase